MVEHGRDGQPSKVVLLYGKPGKQVSDEVKAYATNTSQSQKQKQLKIFCSLKKVTQLT